MTTAEPDPSSRSGSGNSGYTIIAARRMALYTWAFRTAVLLLAYLSAALCCWLIKGSAQPWLEALGPAMGVALGFGVMRWMEMNRDQQEHDRHEGRRRHHK